MEEAKWVFVLFIAINTLAAPALAKDEPVGDKKDDEGQDPKKALENLGTFFKMVSGNNGSCNVVCPEACSQTSVQSPSRGLGSVPLPRPGHNPSSNGCGSMGIKLDTSMFPGFDSCCDIHDKCYDTCNKDRDQCDSDFQDCIDGVCTKAKSTQSQDRVSLCENAGGVMYAAAKGLGCNAFNQAQKRACICSGSAIEDSRDQQDDDDDDDDTMIDDENDHDDVMDKVEL